MSRLRPAEQPAKQQGPWLLRRQSHILVNRGQRMTEMVSTTAVMMRLATDGDARDVHVR